MGRKRKKKPQLNSAIKRGQPQKSIAWYRDNRKSPVDATKVDKWILDNNNVEYIVPERLYRISEGALHYYMIDRINVIKFIMGEVNFNKTLHLQIRSIADISIKPDVHKPIIEVFRKGLQDNQSFIFEAFSRFIVFPYSSTNRQDFDPIIDKNNNKIAEHQFTNNIYQMYNPLFKPSDEMFGDINGKENKLASRYNDYCSDYFILCAYTLMYEALQYDKRIKPISKNNHQKRKSENAYQRLVDISRKDNHIIKDLVKSETPCNWIEFIINDIVKLRNYWIRRDSLPDERRVRVCQYPDCKLLFLGDGNRKYCGRHSASERKKYKKENLL